MTAFAFIGDPHDQNDGTPYLDLYGHRFPRGKTVALDPSRLPTGVSFDRVVQKLRGNAHLREVGPGDIHEPEVEPPTRHMKPSFVDFAVSDRGGDTVSRAEYEKVVKERDDARRVAARHADEVMRLGEENAKLREQINPTADLLEEDLEIMDRPELLKFAAQKGYSVDKRLGEGNLREEIRRLIDAENAG